MIAPSLYIGEVIDRTEAGPRGVFTMQGRDKVYLMEEEWQKRRVYQDELGIPSKSELEDLITKNYQKRMKGLLPDKWYWADRLYMRIYGLNTGFYGTHLTNEHPTKL